MNEKDLTRYHAKVKARPRYFVTVLAVQLKSYEGMGRVRDRETVNEHGAAAYVTGWLPIKKARAWAAGMNQPSLGAAMVALKVRGRS
jgi:hypothetical protein